MFPLNIFPTDCRRKIAQNPKIDLQFIAYTLIQIKNITYVHNNFRNFKQKWTPYNDIVHQTYSKLAETASF